MTSDRPGLVLDDDAAFERRQWRAERIGWLAMAAIVAGAALGLFGHGLFSYRTVDDPSGVLTVAYERVARSGGVTGIGVTVLRRAPEQSDVAITLDHDYLAHVDVESITPTPAAWVTVPDGLRLEFPLDASADELRVQLQVRPDALGPIEGDVRLDDGTQLGFHQFVLP